jgi:hypothetical protein
MGPLEECLTTDEARRAATQDRYYEEFFALVFAHGQRATVPEVHDAIEALDLPSWIDGSRAELERQIERLVKLRVLDVKPADGVERFTLGRSRRIVSLGQGRREQEE